MSKTKTMLFWVAKGCRKPKMQGTATAVCSAVTINQFCNMATDGKGRFYIVEARNANEGREIIASHKRGESTVAMKTVLADGRIVALGMDACLAIAGASDACSKWDERIARQGRVTQEQSRALPKDRFKAWNRENAFGRGLGDRGES